MTQNISNANIQAYNKNQYLPNQQQNPNFSANGSQVSSGAAIVDNNPLLSHAKKPEKPISFVTALGLSSLGLMGINSFINNPLLTKEYDETFFKKVENYFNKFETKPKVIAARNRAGAFKTKLNSIINKSEFLNTLFHKPSIGGPNVQSQAAGAKGHLAQRALEVMKKYVEKNRFTDFDSIIAKAESNGFNDLDSMLEAMKKVKKAHKSMTSLDPFIAALENKSYAGIADVTNALKAKKIALMPKEIAVFEKLIEKAGKDTYKYYDEILNTIKGSSANFKQILSKKPVWGFGLIKNNASLQEILNKGHLINNYKLGGRTLGQKAAGYLMRGTECLTNGMFSGKGQVIFQAFAVAMSLQEAAKAEKGEKVSSFMASLAELMAFIATMGVQMRIVNSLAGLKFIGMSKTNYKEHQRLMSVILDSAKAKDHAVYNSAIADLNKIKTATNANLKWYQKPVKWLGNIFSFGRLNETIKPLKQSGFKTALAKVPYGLKFLTGYAGRFALVFAIGGMFSGIGRKISHIIFGKPVKTIEKEKALAKEEEEKAKAEELKQQQELQKQYEELLKQEQTAQNPQNQNKPAQTAKPGNLLDKMNNMHNNPMAAQTISSQTPAASSVKSPDAGIKRTYVPNPILGQENSVNSSATRSAQIDAVLRQADYAEAMAQKYM